MSVTIDVNDVFEEVVKQNERLVKEIEFYEEVVNDLVINVKTCIVCQQNDVINDRISELETHLKSKTIDNLTYFKSEYNDCDNNLNEKVKPKTLKKTKNTNEKNLTDIDSNKQMYVLSSDYNKCDESLPTNVKTTAEKVNKLNKKQNVKKSKTTTIKKDIVKDGSSCSNGSTIRRQMILLPYSDEYAKQRSALKVKSRISNGRYRCRTCGHQNKNFNQMETHVNRYHLNIKPYKCDICNEYFAGISSLRHHKTVHHYYVGEGLDQLSDRRNALLAKTKAKNQCQLCKQIFKEQMALKNHELRVHRNSKVAKNVKCDICGLMYSTRTAVTNHKRFFHGIGTTVKYYYCDWPECSFKSSNKTQLAYHKNRHSGLKDYMCEWPGCDYKCVDKASLAAHLLVHSDRRDYQCQWPGCELKAKSERRLRIHVRQVHEDRPAIHACHWPGCGKMFRLTEQLRTHMTIHNEPHIPCPQCNKLFKSKRYLKDHMQSHTGRPRVMCPVVGCNTQISCRTNVRSHLKVHHKDWSDNTRLGRHRSNKIQDMSVTIDVNDVFEEVVKQNERLVKEIEFYEEVVNDLVANVKTCVVCQQNDVIKDRINELETHLKSKTTNNLTNVKSEYNDCDNKLKTKTLKKRKYIKKSRVKDVTNVKKSKTTTNKEDISKDDNHCSDGSTITRQRVLLSYSDEYAKQRSTLKFKSRIGNGFYRCRTCGHQNKRFDNLETHVNRYHLNIKPYNCDLCDQHFVGYESLKHHKLVDHYIVGEGLDQLSERQSAQIATAKAKFQCQLCHKFLHEEMALKNHVLRVHHKSKVGKNVKCDICGQMYATRTAVTNHKRFFHGIGSTITYYHCDWTDCLFKTSNKAQLASHKKRHSGLKEWLCEWPGCDYRCVNKTTLDQHLLVHSDRLDYQCQWPGCEFKTKTDRRLQTHVRQVHEDRPAIHECHWPGCGKMFRLTKRLQTHMTIHNEPHIPCPQCNKLFKSKKYLKDHMQSHTGRQRVMCPVVGCNTQISCRTNVRSHLNVHHKDWSGN
ncbi:zinc finger protein 845-like [Oppia nitens]|uniref:zinc finger protein 845-like n=1 Tax=Oppia nitens TaxID=1686743 RepID=UPI0023DB5043|nr:zinc finger protein 845-like [Oppia nitens]